MVLMLPRVCAAYSICRTPADAAQLTLPRVRAAYSICRTPADAAQLTLPRVRAAYSICRTPADAAQLTAWTPGWLAYALISLSVFTGCLLLNYIVNKINEVHLEERLTTLQNKSPAGRVTQVQRPLLEIAERRYPQEERRTDPGLEISNERPIQNVTAKEVEAISDNVQPKPIFLGTIYSELIEVPSNSVVDRANNDNDDVLDQDRSNTVINTKSQTASDYVETLETEKVHLVKSEVRIVNADGLIVKENNEGNEDFIKSSEVTANCVKASGNINLDRQSPITNLSAQFQNNEKDINTLAMKDLLNNVVLKLNDRS
ncbi:uncharacterized protein LOC114364422 [Ostrinia furnacalis]|uniref:uncharacterized protein LOC114364422 n=1 Tax=Ostrinia furnacalis TaxID=93504 RepID=UPI00103FC104|nr:uncharacterized protein LOC114364422 [Ostrinia furnacalis]